MSQAGQNTQIDLEALGSLAIVRQPNYAWSCEAKRWTRSTARGLHPESSTMFVWELVSCRLRVDGWHVWHSTRHDAYGPTYTVHLQRPGLVYEVSGPTLTDAYAAAARRVREP